MSNKNDNNTSHSPQLRFPGFTGEWKEKKWGEIYEKHNEKNDLSFGVDKVISVANMYYKQDANVGNDDYLRTYNIFRLGDIAYEGNKSSNFAYGRFVENTIGDGIVSHVFDVYRPITADYCIDYWKYAINYEPIMRPILEKATIKSTMMNNLIAKDFLRQSILLPPTLAEQQKIADCLSSLDDMINTEGKKTEALREYKRGLMQQLFPANGATTPQLRFSQFTGEWKEKKLGEIGDFIRGLSYNNNEITSETSSTLVIRSNNIIQDGDIDYKNELQYVTRNPSVEQLLRKGDIAICLANGSSNLVGKSASFDGKYHGVATVGAFCGIYRSVNPIVRYLVQTSVYKEKIYLIKQGGNGALANLYGKDILSLTFFFPPSFAEQQKIVECLSSIDDLITAQSQKTEALKEYKRGLMQQLFPQPSK